MGTSRSRTRAGVFAVACFAVLALAGAAGATFNTSRLISVGTTGTDTAVAFEGVSSDGSKVFFSTTDPVLPADTDTRKDIYMRSGSTTTLVTPTTSVAANFAGMSANGATVFFTTTENLDSDADGLKDIYSVPTAGGSYKLLSPGTADAVNLPAYSGNSADGSLVFWNDIEAVAGTGDADTVKDVFQTSNPGGAVTLLSPSTVPPPATLADVNYEGSTPDGAHVYLSSNEKLTTGDPDAVRDLYDRSAGATTLVTPTLN